MPVVLRDSWFDPDPTRHGGHRRAAQVFELVTKAGFCIKDVNRKILNNRWERLFYGLSFVFRYKFLIYPSYRSLANCGQQYLFYRHTLTSCEHNDSTLRLVLWEATNNHILPHVAKEIGLDIVALPQNLESLVPEQVDIYTREKLPESFKREISHLAMANAVFCISREEQWLLRLWGIEAEFLPYYPPTTVISELVKVRSSRLSATQDRFLILGSATNPTTRIGIMEQIHWLDACYQQLPFHVDIVGYGTEALEDLCAFPYVTLHGSVSQDQLNHLLINSKAVLIHQRSALGAITRIPEMLIAGIPVIASAIACRSAHAYDGVYCYDNVDELVGWLSADLPMPKFLQPPSTAESRFLKCLQQSSEH